jgi:AraC family transcriptional regulator
MATVRLLCTTPRLAIHDIACRAARSGKGAPRGGESTHLIFVRHGVFSMHNGARTYIADPCTALISWEGNEYRISHPADAGDDCTVLELDRALADELLRHLRPHRDNELPLSPRMQAAHAGFVALVQRSPDDALGCEEAALDLARTVAGTQLRRSQTTSRGRRALAVAALEMLNDEPAVNRSVSAMSAEIGCSPCHLMHAFRAETGTTLRRYRLQLRVAAALHRLAAGHGDLARLAAELGFASHAHLTDTLSRLVGVAPSHVRAELARADRGWVRRFLEASAAHPA